MEIKTIVVALEWTSVVKALRRPMNETSWSSSIEDEWITRTDDSMQRRRNTSIHDHLSTNDREFPSRWPSDASVSLRTSLSNHFALRQSTEQRTVLSFHRERTQSGTFPSRKNDKQPHSSEDPSFGPWCVVTVKKMNHWDLHAVPPIERETRWQGCSFSCDDR